jgi:hypothetical protein
MDNRLILRMNAARKLVLGMSGAAAIAVPLALGLSASPLLQRQAQAQPAPLPNLNAQRRSEQALPRIAVPFDPTHFDKYVGYYQLGPSTIFTISRDGAHYFSRLTGQLDVELFPESETKFFATVVRAQISFDTDAAGRVTGLVLHQNGLEQPAPRISESGAKTIEAALAQRIRSNTPSPGTEAALRHQIDAELGSGPDYSALAPALATATREQWPVTQQVISGLGPLKSVAFKGVGPGGMDIYDVAFERANTEWRISPLTADGKIVGLGWRRLP